MRAVGACCNAMKEFINKGGSVYVSENHGDDGWTEANITVSISRGIKYDPGMGNHGFKFAFNYCPECGTEVPHD